MNNDLKNLQDAIADRLKGDATLAQVEVLTEERMDLEAAIAAALAQLGVSIVVQTVKVGVSNPNVPGPHFDNVRFSCVVIENVTLNRSPGSTQLDALSLAIAVAERLHHWRPVDVAHFAGLTVLAAPETIEYQPSESVLIYDVNFTLGT